MEERFLPIGSVVILKEATKRIMIIGYCSMTPDQAGKLFDYTGCLYPEGLLSSDQVCLFDHAQIDKIFYKGYDDEEGSKFRKTISENYDKIVEASKENAA